MTLFGMASSEMIDLSPIGLNRSDAAAYVRLSLSAFDRMVETGQLPPPLHINWSKVWEVRKLDDAFKTFRSRTLDE